MDLHIWKLFHSGVVVPQKDRSGMSTHDAPCTPKQEAQSQFPRRPPEVDRFVNRFLSVVCDPSRRSILEMLVFPDPAAPDPHAEPVAPVERSSGEIARTLGLSASTTSAHLHQLAAAGLVLSRREGHTVYYRLSNHLLIHAFHELLLALDQAYAFREGAQEQA
jgi:DNA-binding transcriptional ArsR family regulator